MGQVRLEREGRHLRLKRRDTLDRSEVAFKAGEGSTLIVPS